MASVGGTAREIHYAFGDIDLFAIVEAPSDEAALAAELAATSTGRVKVKVTPLMTPAQIDEAAKMTGQYRAPGA